MTTRDNKTTSQIECRTESTTSNTYVKAQGFIFAGSNSVGPPTSIKALSKVSNASLTGDVRIQDVTNSLTICEVTGIADTTYTIKDLGTISNVPAAESIWEIQLRHPGGGGDTVSCDSVCIEF